MGKMYRILHIPTALLVCGSENNVHHKNYAYKYTYDTENCIVSYHFTNIYPILFHDKKEVIRYLEDSWLYSLCEGKYIRLWHRMQTMTVMISYMNSR